MSVLVWSLIALTLVWSLFYFRASLMIWSLVLLTSLTTWTWLDGNSPYLQSVAWILSLAALGVLNIRPLRRQLLSNRIFYLFKKVVPPMSATEQEALNAGTVWWDGELFSGAPRWNKLLQFPKPALNEEEQAFLDGPVEQLCRMLNDWEITHLHYDLPEEVWNYIKDNGFFGMIIPKRFGGLGFSALAHSAVVEKIASRSVTAAVTVMVPNSLGPAELLLRYGTEAQKNHYLPRLATGEEIPCFALTGPEAGSDASAMPDRGVVCKQDFDGRKDVLGIRLNWEKRYITLGPVATLLGLAFKLYDPEHLLGDKEELGITAALIPTDTPGIEIGRRHFPVNIPFQNGPNKGKDVFIPIDWIIGGRNGAGQGWRMLMECLAAGRSISLPALSTGASKLCARAVGAYARIRRQFNLPIGRFEGIEEALARIGGLTYMLESTRRMTAGAVDQGEEPAVVSAIAKYYMTESMRKVVNDAMDIQGGAAICLGPRNFLARAYQALPISITVEGANILTRCLIIFGQGAIRCHPYVLAELEAAKDEDTRRGAVNFDYVFFRHTGFTLSNMARSLFLGLTNARFVRRPSQTGVHKQVVKYYQQLTRMSSALALASDMSMLALGGELKRKERLSGRLADVLGHLYLASATLKRFHDDGSPQQDLPLVDWVCRNSLFTIQESLMELFRNYPIRPLAHFLRILVFPFGQTYRKPSDRLGHKVASILLSPSAARERLTQGIYCPTDTSQVIGRLDSALKKVIAAEEAEHKLRNAMRAGRIDADSTVAALEQAVKIEVITEQEAGLIRAATKARSEIIAVDDFPADLGLAVARTGQASQPVLETRHNVN